MASGQELCMEHDRLEDGVRVWKPTWQDVADFVMPKRTGINRTVTPGTQNMERVLEGTAIQANELLAASMQGSLTSSSIKWFTLGIKGMKVQPGSEEDKWLFIAAKVMYDFLKYSNFSGASSEMYQDLSAFGTGCLYSEDAPMKRGVFGGIRFKAFSIGSYIVQENFEGEVDTIYRKFMLTAHQAVGKWGKKVDEGILKAAEKEPAKQWPFLHCVHPRHLASYGLGPQSRPFAGYYVDYEHKKIMDEHGYYEFPYAVPRWSKASEEEYGRGPGMTALPDTKSLNKLVELHYGLLGKIVNPPLKVRDAGVMGPVRLSAGGLTHVRDMDSVQPLELGKASSLQAAAIDAEKLQVKIRNYFYADQLQMPNTPAMTAYEVQVRYELMQRLLGPTLGRIEAEFQNKVVERVFHICLRNGQFPPMPGSIKKLYMAGKLDIEYEGPLARAAKLTESLALQRFFQIALPIAQAKPDVMDRIDVDEALKIHAEAVGIPATVIRSDEDVDQIRKARLEAQQEANAEQQQAGLAEALGKLAPFLKASGEQTGASLAGRM